MTTKAALDAGVNAVTTHIGGTAGKEVYLTNAASSLVDQSVNLGLELTSAQTAGVLDVIEQSSSVAAGNTVATTATVSLLNNIKKLPVALTSDQVLQTFRVLKNQESAVKVMGPATFNTVIDNLAITALKSMSSSGQKSITVDVSPGVKASVERLDDDLTNTVGVSSVLSVTMSSDALKRIKGNNTSALSANVAMYTAITIPENVTTDTSSTGASSNLVSRAFTVKVIGLTSAGNTLANVSSLPSSPVDERLVFTMSFTPEPDATKTYNYVVKYFDTATSMWVSDSTIEATFNSATGKVVFKTPHLTQFAVFAEEGTAAAAGGGGGGGCLLK